MVVLDTSIIIDHLRCSTGQSKLIRLVESHPHQELGISLITVQELYEGQSTLIEAKETDLITVLAGLKVLPYTFDVAKLAGTIARDLPHPIELADAAIASTAILNFCPLYTLNPKDFLPIPGLDLFQPLSSP